MSLSNRNAPSSITPPPVYPQVAGKFRALVRFTRPHTVIGTTFQVIGVFIIVSAGTPLTTDGLVILALAWLGSQAANLYVVGLNQLTDVSIDRLNKPDLPLANGALTRRQGVIIVGIAGPVALLIGASQSFYLLLTLALVMLIGTAYSLPGPRLKARPLAAAFSIALARGVIANLGLFLHYHASLHRPLRPFGAQPIWALLFFFGFGLVIALFKDIPDRDGDEHYAVRTFAVRWGRRRVYNLGRWLLTAVYLLAVVAGVTLLPAPAGVSLVFVHLTALGVFWAFSLFTDPARPASMMRLYLTLWFLFYAEYIFLSLHALVFNS